MWRSDVVVWSLSLSQHNSRAIAHEIFGCSDRDRRRVDSRETRTVTNGEMVKAGRLQQKMELGAELPSTHEKQTCTAAHEKQTRLATPIGYFNCCWQPGNPGLKRSSPWPMEYANHEASILKDALLPMKDEDWWAYKFELIGGWMPFLDAIQNGTLP